MGCRFPEHHQQPSAGRVVAALVAVLVFGSVAHQAARAAVAVVAAVVIAAEIAAAVAAVVAVVAVVFALRRRRARGRALAGASYRIAAARPVEQLPAPSRAAISAPRASSAAYPHSPARQRCTQSRRPR